MKKNLSKASWRLLTWLCVCLGLANQVSGQNLLLDPGFEERNGSWTCYDGAEICYKLPNQDPPTIHGGASSLALMAKGGVAYVGAYQIREATPNAQYTLGGWALNSIHSQLSNGCYGLAKIIFMGLGMEPVEHTSENLVDPTGPWKPFEFSAVAPPGTTHVQFDIMLRQSANPAGTLYYDDVYALQAIPEPGSAGVFAVGLLGFAVVARRFLGRAGTARGK